MHKLVWRLAFPILLANITVPLLGAVDLAVVGHLPGPEHLAAIGVGATLFSLIFFGFNFLRMATTGLVAISYGQNQPHEGLCWLIRSLCIAFGIGIGLIAISPYLSQAAIAVIEPPITTIAHIQNYVSTRIFAAPATLANFALLGWMIGSQRTKQALVLQILINVTNIILDIWFVLGLNMGIQGAALATVIAEYVGLFGAFCLNFKLVTSFLQSSSQILSHILDSTQFSKLFKMNANIMVRSLCLQLALFYFTIQGATISAEILAVNAIMMNFQMFMAYGLDGFANAAEALVGQAIGKQQRSSFYLAFKVSSMWALAFACLFTVSYAALWHPIVQLMTNVVEIQELLTYYIAWAIFLPLVSVWSFHLDGIFIGASMTKPMRNSMVLSLLFFIISATYLTAHYGNHGLWASFFGFMVFRAIALGLYWSSIDKLFNQQHINAS